MLAPLFTAIAVLTGSAAVADPMQAARDATLAYLNAREAGDIAAAYGMMTDDLQSEMSLSDFTTVTAQARDRAGRLVGFQVLRQKAYPGPPPRISLDFIARYANAMAECGFIVWTDEPEGRPQLARLQSGYLLDRLVGTPEGVAMMKELGCVAIPAPETAAEPENSEP